MLRHDMVETVGKEFLTSNIEAGEYSYVQAAGGKSQLEAKVGHPVSHFKLDIRFEMDDVVVLIETSRTMWMMMKSSCVNILKKNVQFIRETKLFVFLPIQITIKSRCGSHLLMMNMY